MKRTVWITILIIILIVLVGIIIALFIDDDLFNDKVNNSTINNRVNIEEILEDNVIDTNVTLIETAAQEEKISPDCIFIFKTYYARCDHIKIEKEQVSESMVNKTKEELEKIYKNWQIITYRSDEVLFYKEEEAMCDEHFVVKELDGNIGVYVLDDNETETIKEVTTISTTYLPEEDLLRLKEGIRADGKEELNRVLEDFE